jgi:hypothetical protein
MEKRLIINSSFSPSSQTHGIGLVPGVEGSFFWKKAMMVTYDEKFVKSREAIRLVMECMDRLLASPQDIDTRTIMMWQAALTFFTAPADVCFPDGFAVHPRETVK